MANWTHSPYHVSYSDECRTKKSFSVWLKHGTAFSCCNSVSLWKNANNSMNLQYDSYKNIKDVLQVVRLEHKEKLKSQLPSQGFIISFLSDYSLVALNSLWSSTQSKLPKNIFNFTVRYLNNTLANHTNPQMETLTVARLFCFLVS